MTEERPSLRALPAIRFEACRVHSRDGIAQFIPPREPWGQTTFKLDGREHLRHVHVCATKVHAYGRLLSVGGGR